MDSDPKCFTLREANRTLPLVRRIVRDIVEAYPALQEKLHRLQESAVGGGNTAEQRDIVRLREEIDEDAERINGFINELHRIGCVFKGVDDGLVDFYALHENRPICLCWKLDEGDRIEWWHEVEAGFAGRQRITAEIAGAQP